MTSTQSYAMDMTKEIVVAKMSSSTITICPENSQAVANFFEEIYKKVYEIASKEEQV